MRSDTASAVPAAIDLTVEPVFRRAEHHSRRNAVAALMLLTCLAGPGASWAQWRVDGIPVCAASNTQQDSRTISDGNGGAVVTWMDVRSGTHLEIYAQRLDEVGMPQWAQDGVLVCNTSATSFASATTSDGAGGVIVAWQDYRSGTSYDIYAQRVDATGAIRWGADGVAVCKFAGNQMTPTIVPDGGGGVIIAWEDVRSGSSSDRRVYAQSLDMNGLPRWTLNGVNISPALTYYPRQSMCPDGSGGAIIAWDDTRNGPKDIYAQRIDATGAVQWAAGGVGVTNAAGSQESSVICPDGAGGAVIAWIDSRNGGYDVFAQRVDAAGVPAWSADGIAVCAVVGTQFVDVVVPDDAGGAIIVWEDDRSGPSSNNYNVYAQHVSSTGQPGWTANGMAICAAAGGQRYPAAVGDGSGGAIIAWQDRRGTTTDVYAQRIGSDGAAQWLANGLAICTAEAGQGVPSIASDGAGGAIVAWTDSTGGWGDIYARRVPTSGLHTITASWNEGGQIELLSPGPQVKTAFTIGPTDAAVVRIRPNPGYYIDHVMMDGVAIGVPPNLDIGHATGDHALIAGFANTIWSEPWVATPARAYTTCAFPLTFDASGVRQVLGELGDYDDRRWRLARWDPAAERYQFAGDGLSTIEAGAGYWLITADGAQVQASGWPLTDESVSVPLMGDGVSGWNQIANPYRFPIADTALRVVAGGTPVRLMDAANVYTDQLVWEWKGGANYDSVRTLEPRRAYWVRRKVPDPVQLVFPNWTSKVAGGSPALNPAGAEWSVSLVARQGDRASMRVLLGRWERMATSEAMRLEGPPASPGGGLSLHAGRAGDAMAGRIADFTSDDGPWSWVLDLKGAQSPGEVRLEVEGYELPPGLRLWVEEQARGWSQEVRPGGAVSLAALGAERHLTLRAAYEDRVNSPMLATRISTAYPNPFREQVGLVLYLARAGDIRLDVCDIQGRRVRRIDMRGLGAGEHVMVWDGRDDSGRVVPNGVYLASCRAGGVAGAQRLLKLQ